MDIVVKCCEGQLDLRTHTADCLLREKMADWETHLGGQLAAAQIEALKRQLGQVLAWHLTLLSLSLFLSLCFSLRRVA
eukprot:COSAG05_NODE_1702_length_4249_cov_136.320607_5_plen_78_part_00